MTTAAELDPDGRLRRHLVATALAGEVATPPRSTLANCGKLLRGDPEYHFGLPDWRDVSFLEAVDAVRALCGGDPGGADQNGPGWIEPEHTLWGMARHRDVLASAAATGGLRVLFATGHPTGLLGHYAAIARALQDAGCLLLTPLDDVRDSTRRGLRFIEGVGCLFNGADLLHTHRADWMERALDHLGDGPGTVDLVLADHGFAGAAIARGIPTLSIADVNDPALPLAQVRRRTDSVLPIDDNLAPTVFTPVTQALLDW